MAPKRKNKIEGSKDTQFKKGGPGGPGRPKQKGLIQWCKAWTQEFSQEYLAGIATDPKHKQQLDAIKTIMAYAEGKPLERSETSIQHEGMAKEISKAPEQLGDIIAQGERDGMGDGKGRGADEDMGTA